LTGHGGDRHRFHRRSILASGLLHGLLGALVLSLTIPQRLSAPEEESVDVTFVAPAPSVPEKAAEEPRQPSAPQSAEIMAERPAAAESPLPEPSPPEPPPDETPAMVKPSRMLSEKVLADPRSRKTRKELAALAPADQVEQLCGLEAMAQVGAWSKALRPDRVVAYAMADPKMTGNVLSADGAALHSRKEWFRLKFRCELTPDHKKVASFAFLMGDPIPREDWAEHSLPDENGSLD